jgi:MscS family membrane protein
MNHDLVTTLLAGTSLTFQETWFMMPNWKWIGLASALFLGFALIGLLRPLLSGLSQSFQKRTPPTSFACFLCEQPLHRPLAWLFVSLLWLVTWKALALPTTMENTLRILSQIILSIAVVRLAYMMVEAGGRKLSVYVEKTPNSLDDQLVSFATKSLKILIIVLGLLIVLQNFGVNVTSLLAGLGIGGLAIAFAAQETVANVFGSITIITDRPFQVGDQIKVTDTEGTVEEVGFRSTRIRTPYQSVVAVPNSIMAKEKIDNMGVRPRRRIRHTIGLTYAATQEQIRYFTDKVRFMLTRHPQVYKDDVTVVLSGFGDSSLNVLVNCFVVAATWNEEIEIQEYLLFEIMTIAKETGVEFAFPTRTLHMAGPVPGAPT